MSVHLVAIRQHVRIRDSVAIAQFENNLHSRRSVVKRCDPPELLRRHPTLVWEGDFVAEMLIRIVMLFNNWSNLPTVLKSLHANPWLLCTHPQTHLMLLPYLVFTADCSSNSRTPVSFTRNREGEYFINCCSRCFVTQTDLILVLLGT